jgi:hypothetical protein
MMFSSLTIVCFCRATHPCTALTSLFKVHYNAKLGAARPPAHRSSTASLLNLREVKGSLTRDFRLQVFFMN